MVVIPDTEIRLLKCPISLDNKNQLNFYDINAQYNYFNSLPNIKLNNASYLRKDGFIRFNNDNNLHFEQLLEYNYVMYKNSNYSDKWFYAFIINMEYINDGLVNIYIETDVFQSWLFDWIFHYSFIEREMINPEDDIPGNNLLPEGLETGEFKPQSITQIPSLEPVYIVAYSEDSYGHSYNGIFSGIQYYAYSDINILRGFLLQIKQAGKDNYILNIFTVPKLAFNPLTDFNGIIDDDIKGTPINLDLFSRPNNLDGYIPKNKKLLTYPYCYCSFNPSTAEGNIFRFEDFVNGYVSFNGYSEINPNPELVFIPKNHNGFSLDYSNIVSMNGYPNISWSNDVFNVWLAQNSNFINLKISQAKDNLAFSHANDILDTTSNLLNLGGNFIGLGDKTQSNGRTGYSGISNAVISTGKTITSHMQNQVNYEYLQKNQLAEMEYHAKLPNEGNFGSNGTTLIGYNLFSENIFSIYTIKYQFAKIIDDYFSMYGYSTKQVKLPNLNNRPNWNYIKTINCIITGNIPDNDLLELKSLFNNGITIWHNPSTFLDYSKPNN